MSRSAICCISTYGYLYQTLCLAQSIRRRWIEQPDILILLLDHVERPRPGFSDVTDHRFISPAALAIPGFNWLKLKFTAMEIACACKPFLLRYTLLQGYDLAWYIDSDILFLSDPSDLRAESAAHDLVATPHIFEPLPNREAWLQPTMGHLARAGLLNAGLFTMRRSDATLHFLNEWALMTTAPGACLMELSNHQEQNAFNWAPVLMQDVFLNRDKRINVAYWNLHERPLRWAYLDGGPNDQWLLEGEPICCFHFSGFSGKLDRLSCHDYRTHLDLNINIHALVAHYDTCLEKARRADYSPVPFEFAFIGTLQLNTAVRRQLKFLESQETVEVVDWSEEEATRVVDRLLTMPGSQTLLPKLLEEIYFERPDLQALHRGESLFLKTFLCWCPTHLEAEYGERVPFFRSSLIAVHRETLMDLVKQCSRFLPTATPAWLAEALIHDRPHLLTRLQNCPNAAPLIKQIKAAEYLVVAVNPVLALRLMIEKWPFLFRSLPALNSGNLVRFRKQLSQTITTHFIWPEAHTEFLNRLDPEASLARVIAGVRHPYLWPELRKKGLNRTFLSLLVPLLTADISFDATDLALLDWCLDSSASSTGGYLPIVRQHLRRGINRLAEQSPLFEQWARWILSLAHPHPAKPETVVTGEIHFAPQGGSPLSAGTLSARLTPLLATEEDEQQWMGYLGWWALRNKVYETGEINKEKLKTLDQQIATPDTRRLGARIPELMPEANGLNIFGYFKSPIGLGQMSRGLAAAHTLNGHPFRPLVLTNITMSADLRVEDLHPNYAFHFPRNIVVTYPHINYDLTDIFPHRFFRGRETIGYIAWEQRDLHPEWCKRLDPYDRLFAVSQFTADSVTRATGRICQVLPCVVEMDIPRAKAFTRRDFDLPEDDFLAGFMFDASSSVNRKNPLGAAQALVRAFRGRKGVQVVIKVSNGDRPQFRYVIDSLADLFIKNGISHRLITRVMPRAEVEGLLAQLNLYVSLHRAEGFGYTIAEAMWLGVPVVATGYSGNLDFMYESNSYPVRYRECQVRIGEGPFQPGTVWADPDVDHAAELCDHIFTDRESTRLKTEQAEKDIRAMVSVGAVAARLRTLLE